MSRSTTKAAAVSFECVLLLWYALDHKNSEFGVFIADFPGFQICRRSIRGLRLLHVLKNRQNDARFWRFARDSCGLATGDKLFLAALFEGFHSERNVLLRISAPLTSRNLILQFDISSDPASRCHPITRPMSQMDQTLPIHLTPVQINVRCWSSSVLNIATQRTQSW